MQSTSFQKSSRRTVKSSLTRFVSIAVISFLGAGVFAGLAATSPNMQRAGDEYYDWQNVMDVRLLSTYGFSDQDVKAIRNTAGVSGVMESYFVDATGTVGDKDYTFRVNGLSPSTDSSSPDYINQLKLVSGRWPQNGNEAIIVRPSIGLKNITLGSKVTLKKDSNSALPDTLDRTDYTVVGITESPYYLFFMQGDTSVGNGLVDYVIYVPQKNFIVDGYTDLYVTVTGAKALNTFENSYFSRTDVTVVKLKNLAKKRQTLRYDKFRSDLSDAKQKYSGSEKEANNKLADAKAKLDGGKSDLEDAKGQYIDGLSEYNSQKADADRKLADAKAQLDKGAKELADAKDRYADGLAEYNRQKSDADQQLVNAKKQLETGANNLKDAKKKYADGLVEYGRQKADAEKQMADAQAQFDAGTKKLEDAKEQYSNGLSEYKRQKAEVQEQLADAREQLKDASEEISNGERELSEKQKELDDAKAQYSKAAADAEKSTGMTVEQIEAALPSMQEQLDEENTQYEGLVQLKALRDARNAAEPDSQEYVALNSQYQAALQAASLTEQEAEAQFAQLDAMKDELGQAQAQYARLAQLVEAKKQIEQSEQTLADGKEELASAKRDYQDGLKEYRIQKAKADRELAAAKTKLDNAAAQIADGEQEFAKKQQEYDESKADTEKKLADAKAELDRAPAKIENGEKELAEKQQEYDESEAEADRKFADAKAELDDAATKIRNGENELAEKQREYDESKAEADRKFDAAKAELDAAAVKIRNGETELADKQKEYEEQKAEADTKLADAKQKIDDSEQKLSDLGEPKWYVLDRHMDESFVNYEDDTKRMHDLATVFPVIFFLVAALVCLTTMTRMVDEDRTLIGTFKALGYSNAQIASRYLKYAASASLIGSVTGVCTGFWLLPTIIWNAYGIVFALPEMAPAFYFGIAVMSIFATVFIITLSTGVAAKNSLRESPADLMRPKAPKSGKRVFMEYVKPVWSRLSFTKKVTLRNLGLNKKRLVMTLIGIIGCTALVVTAFGAKNAVRTILDGQFGEIFHYDVLVGFTGKEPSAQLTSLLSNGAYFKKSSEVLRKTAEASPKEDKDDTDSIYVVSPKDAKTFTDYVTLTDPSSKKNFSFRDDSAVITEKLAMNLNVGVGDTIMVKYLDENERHPVIVTGITKNYAFNYVYLGKTAYQKTFEKPPGYNQFFAIKTDNHTNDQIKTYLSPASDIGAISFTDDLMGNIRTSTNSVDNIIWILIIAAGLLAFVVLYNLTNINIGERQRELATLKVLGFYDRETYSYIFRETVILSINGCLMGLFGGIFLYRAVVSTVEPSVILLTRDLTWQGYFGAAVLTMFFTWIVNQCMKPRIKNIDMLESLKSVD